MKMRMNQTESLWTRASQSLRTRLLIGTLLWISIALFITGTALAILFKNHATQQFDQELRTHLTQLVANLNVSDEGKPLLRTQPADARFMQPLSGLYWQISDEAQRDILRSRSLWDAKLDFSPKVTRDGKQSIREVIGPKGENVRLLEQVVKISEAPDDLWRISVASETNSLDHAIEDWVKLLVLFLGILLLTLIIAAVAQVFLALSPLRNLQQALIKLGAGHTKRLEGDFPVEIRPLVQELNQVLSQNEAMLVRAQNRAGDFAHAMKTPLTVLSNAAETELKSHSSQSGLAMLMTEQIALLKNHVDEQLLRARSEAVSVKSHSQTIIEPVVDQLIRVMKKIYADKNLSFTIEQRDRTLYFPADANTLQEILGNLLDNASKWAKSKVQIKIFRHHQQLHIAVEDDGRGVPVAQLNKIRQRGVRADERTPGSGLGLSIVTELCSVYGGELILYTSALGGLGAEISIPDTHITENA